LNTFTTQQQTFAAAGGIIEFLHWYIMVVTAISWQLWTISSS